MRSKLNVQALETRWMPADVGGTLATAAPLNLMTRYQTVKTEEVPTATDVDMYSFTAKAGHRLCFDIDTSNSQYGLNSLVRLFNAAGTELAENNAGRAPGDPAAGSVAYDPYLDYTFATAGTYYLGVSQAGNPAYNPVTGVGVKPMGYALDPSYTLAVTDYAYYRDLEGSTLTGPALSLFGLDVEVRTRVANRGALNASLPFGVRYYLSKDAQFSADDLPMTVGADGLATTYPAVAADSVGPEKVVGLRLPARPAGWSGSTFYIVQQIDPTNQVVEMVEGNNSGAGLGRDAVKVILAGANAIGGTVAADVGPFRPDDIPVSLQRVGGEVIQSGIPTWVVSHGRVDNPESMRSLAEAVDASAGGDQVLLLDWSVGAHDNFTEIGLDGAMWIPHVGQWVADRMADLGVSASNLRLIGHSWGSYVCYETAARVPGAGERLVALDPATAGFGYNFLAINFAAVTARSWAFYGAGIYGNPVLAGTADEAFKLDYGAAWWSTGDLEKHLAPIRVFEQLVRESNKAGGAARAELFDLDNLLAPPARPWAQNGYDFLFEGIIEVGDFDLDGQFGEGLLDGSFADIKKVRFINPFGFEQSL